jgi:hypothetical protein
MSARHASLWLPVLSIGAALSCSVEPVDFTGKTCSGNECPDGYRCDPTYHICLETNAPAPGKDASSVRDAHLDLDATLDAGEPEDASEAAADARRPGRDGSVAKDGSTGSDAQIADDAGLDASAPGRDAAAAEDAAAPGPDAASSGLDAAAPGPDAGNNLCNNDGDCAKFGASWCGTTGTCVPCNVDAHCGSSCQNCGAAWYCGGGSCQPCNTAQKCGQSCVGCGPPMPVCNGSSCVECAGDGDCPVGRPRCSSGSCVECSIDSDCGSSQWCNAHSCVPCGADARHCGLSCTNCSGVQQFCDGSQCVQCLGDSDCLNLGLGSTCCKSQCATPQTPVLSSISPIAVSTYGTFTLVGANFHECSQVRIDGQPFPVTYVSPSQLNVDLSAGSPGPGGHPVSVYNPGGGGASNPDGFSLGMDLPLTGSVEASGVAYLSGKDLVLVVNDSFAQVDLVDATHWMPLGSVPLPAPATSIAAGAQTAVVGLQCCNEVDILPNLPAPDLYHFGAEAEVRAVDDEADMQALVATASGKLQLLHLPDGPIDMSSPMFPSPCCTPFGVVLMSTTQWLAFDNDAGWYTPPFYQSVSTFGRYGIAADRSQRRVLLPQTNQLNHYDLNGQLLGAVAVNTGGFVAVNSASVATLVPAQNPAAISQIDLHTYQVAGDIGPIISRQCSGKGSFDQIVVDPVHNRAFVTNSCSMRLEGYNLNYIFVR